ncbi:triosephosphate isomerase [Cedecea colo]|uniref:Triosephosphate isomerase n=1 Tax=Cedecea colo TaxID=2552946 RepID=A0ABX0VTC1_9ENTR|nr:triosephosphate isomerase [Cedecea colo]
MIKSKAFSPLSLYTVSQTTLPEGSNSFI